MQPTLRFREETFETAGIIQNLDSLAITQLEAAELAGTKTKVVPKAFICIGSTKYTAS